MALVLTSLAQAGDKTYSLADLKALAEQQSYEELLAHATDVAPAQRTPQWQGLVEKAVNAVVEDTPQAERAWKMESFAKRFAFLKKSGSFKGGSSKAELAAAEQCFKGAWQGQECLDRLTHAVDRAKDSQFAFDAAKVVMRNQNPYVAMPLFAKAIEGKSASARCQDEALQRCVVAALGLPSDDARVKDAQGVADTCFDKLKKGLLVGLKDGSSYYRDNACPLLTKKKALSKTEAASCQPS